MAKTTQGTTIKEKIGQAVQSGFFQDDLTTIIPIAFLLDNAVSSQAFFNLATNIGPLSVSNHRYEYSIYIDSLSRLNPPIWPSLAIYEHGEFHNFNGHGIATSVETLRILTHSNCKYKYFYVYDIVELMGNLNEETRSLLDGITIFTRTKEYSDFLNSKGVKAILSTAIDFIHEPIAGIIAERVKADESKGKGRNGKGK